MPKRPPIIAVILFILLVIFGFIYTVRSTKNSTDQAKTRPDPLIERYSPPGVPTHTVKKSGFKIIGDIGPGFSPVVRVPILLYHYVEYVKDKGDTIRQSLTVNPYWFEEQAKYLINNGYTTITLGDLYEVINNQKKIPQKPVIITFDDGYRDFYTDAFPILQKYNLKATNFVFPNVLDKPNNMDTWMVKKISDSGLVTIGSHTLSHIYMPKVNEKHLRTELVESKSILEKIIGKPVDFFAYPYGAYDEKSIEEVKKAGYKLAVATTLGSAHNREMLFKLSRIRVGNYSGELFQKRLDL